MPHHVPLIATIVIGLVLAFALGYLVSRIRLSPLVGYLVAGILVGPFTPGFVADLELAPQLAEIGVILLMFGVGLHFSLDDLLEVRRISVPGAVAQIAAATALGWGLALSWGWGSGAGLVFGLALSVASTVVLLRALEQLDLLRTEQGRIAIGWLIVEDLAMILVLVLLPPLAGLMGGNAASATDAQAPNLWLALAVTLGKVALFVALMLIGGRRLVPWLLARIAQTGSRELFTLGVLAIALGIAFGSAQLFSVSFALGAFFAGMVLSESDLSHRAAQEVLPLRDAFAVLFFVSVGMLFDPSILVREPLRVLAVVAVILFGKSLAAFALVLAFRYPVGTALTVAVSLAQIGEFSFILAGLGVGLGVMPTEGQTLILAGALLSIIINPLLFAALNSVTSGSRLQRFFPQFGIAVRSPAEEPAVALQDHAIIVGSGRVGSRLMDSLVEAAMPFVAVELQRERVDRLRSGRIPVIYGNGTAPGVLEKAGIAHARLLIVTVPDGFEAARIVECAHQLNPRIQTIARAHSDEEVAHLEQRGVSAALMGEREIARRMAELAGDAMQPASESSSG